MVKKFLFISVLSPIVFTTNLSVCQAVAAESYRLGQVVVSASRLKEYVSETGSSVSVITSREIEQKKYNTVLDAVRGMPGIAASSNGDFGGATSVFIRGSDSGHTLIMMDGARLYDPISTNATYDLSNLTLDNVERIEIIKGPQSSLYGSDAIGGVINIITKKGKGEPTAYGAFEAGYFNTYTEKLGARGKINNFKYTVEASRQDTDGYSKARDGDEDDEYERTAFNSNLRYSINENMEFGIQSMYLKSKFDLDDDSFQDDPNYWMKYENILEILSADHRINEIWDYSLQYSWLRNVREYFDDNDSVDTAEYYRANYKGWVQEADWQNNIDVGKLLDFYETFTDVFTAGVQHNHERGEGKSTYGDSPTKSSHIYGYYGQNKFSWDKKLFTTIALRVDDHSRFGNNSTGRATLSYLFPTDTRLKGSYGTGFNAPSLYQLYSDYGDINLNPEKSWGYDAGLEQELFDKRLFIGCTFFYARDRNLIEYDSSAPNPKLIWQPFGKYVNRGTAKTKGIEAEMNYHPFDFLSFNYSFTYTSARDLQNKYHLIRRPNNKHNININYSPADDVNINMEIARNVKIFDTFVWGQAPERLKDYTVVNFAASYQATEQIEIYGKVDNVFD